VKGEAAGREEKRMADREWWRREPEWGRETGKQDFDGLRKFERPWEIDNVGGFEGRGRLTKGKGESQVENERSQSSKFNMVVTWSCGLWEIQLVVSCRLVDTDTVYWHHFSHQ
jgi:hypothetical protein